MFGFVYIVSSVVVFYFLMRHRAVSFVLVEKQEPRVSSRILGKKSNKHMYISNEE